MIEVKVDDREIGLRIQAYLKEKGIKQSFIAEKLGFTDSKLSGICNGQRGITCVDYARICKALGVEYGTFLEGLEV